MSNEMTVHEVSQLLGLTEAAVRNAIARGDFPVVRRLGHVRVTPAGIEEFVRKRDRR
jgi:predicted DNA-binding transcriptional regulator AlpA